ncbi:UNVERIFIED_CONTAM: hypothetical protein Slati_1843500 [Sesamum latifolium]|uniref:Secreted protein n=1 Tax=Sesamum latifolium TaxID=2727402 RepID=A0AAW2X0P2_9LAMI
MAVRGWILPALFLSCALLPLLTSAFLRFPGHHFRHTTTTTTTTISATFTIHMMLKMLRSRRTARAMREISYFHSWIIRSLYLKRGKIAGSRYQNTTYQRMEAKNLSSQ